MTSLALGFVAFVVCLCAIPAAIYAARKLGFVDKPNNRKTHAVPTPILGGVAVFFSLAVVSFFNPNPDISPALIFWLSLVLLLGVFDDYLDISYRLRLLCHACVVVGIFSTTGLAVIDVGALTGGGTFRMVGFASVFFTIVGVLGAINSFNMVDGVDGLLCSLSIVSIATILLYSVNAVPENHDITTVGISIVIGTLLAFLLFNSQFFNLNKALVFMGDSGSTTIGFLIAYLLIDYSQGPGAAISPVLAGWIIGVPLLDASGVIVCRLLRRRSPFSPDRSHFHHLMMDNGYTANQTVLLMVSLQIFMIAVAVSVISGFPVLAEAILFWAFISLVVVRACLAMLVFNPEIKRESAIDFARPDRQIAEVKGDDGLVHPDFSGVTLDGHSRVARAEDRKLVTSD